MHKESLKRYFETESSKGDLSSQQWEDLLLHVKSHKQRQWFWRPMPSLFARRLALSAATSLALVVIVVGISLWLAAPWERGHSDMPGPPLGWGLVSIPGEPGLPGIAERSGPPGEPGLPEIGYSGPPGGPAPIIVEKAWEVDNSPIMQGEPLTITLTLRNVWDDWIEIIDFPSAATLNQVYVDDEEQMQVELKRSEGASSILEPGEEFTAAAEITSDMSAGLQPGRYGIRLDVSIERGPDRRGSRLGFSTGSFVVVPPEGALDTTVVVDRAREADGIRVTLERLDFSPEQSTVTVFAASPPNVQGASAPASAPMPAATATVVVRQGATPTPAPGSVIEVYPDLTALYRVDGGAWRELRQYSYRETPDGVRREWTFGPLSANAESFELAVESVAHPGSDAVLTWEWVVPLSEGDRN